MEYAPSNGGARRNPIWNRCCRRRRRFRRGFGLYENGAGSDRAVGSRRPDELGTDGFGRSDTRPNLRRFFEVDAELTTLATLYALYQKGLLPAQTVEAAIKKAWHRSGKIFSVLSLTESTAQAVMDVKLPQLAEGVESGTVVNILVSEGQEIKKDQPFMELETQKAVGSIPSPSSGTVTKIHVKEGMEVSVGQVLISIESGAKSNGK